MSLESRVASGEKLPVHGFVLAGGKSSRMGVDKATLKFRGRALVEIAVGKLGDLCADVSIVGNREDLRGFGEVVDDERLDCGPGAGIEAGLKASRWEWAMFVPVDVPLVPVELLWGWVEFIERADRAPEEAILGDLVGSYLYTPLRRQPSFCMLRRRVAAVLTKRLDRGERRLEDLLGAAQAEFGAASIIALNSVQFVPVASEMEIETYFLNVNTPDELVEAEAWAELIAGK